MGCVPHWPRCEAGVAGQVTGTSWLLWLYLNNCPLSDYRLAYVDADKKECMMRLNCYFLNHDGALWHGQRFHCACRGPGRTMRSAAQC